MSSTAWLGSAARRQPDRDDDLADDRRVVLEQQVVVLADGAVDHVLDGNNAGGVGRPGRERLEYGAEAANGSPVHVAEGREHRVLGERSGLAGVDDLAAGWVAFHGW